MPADRLLQLGTWGGDSAGLIVSDTAMHLHIGCTYGDVSGRVPVDDGGAFDAAGSYVLQAYPVMVGPSMPARFVGRLDDKALTVTVTISDTIEHRTVVHGPVQVELGQDPELGPCPICRRPIVTRRAEKLQLDDYSSRAPSEAQRQGGHDDAIRADGWSPSTRT